MPFRKKYVIKVNNTKLATKGRVCFLKRRKVETATTAKIEIAVCFVRKARENKIPATIEYLVFCFDIKNVAEIQRKRKSMSTRAISNHAPPNLKDAINPPAATNPKMVDLVLSFTARNITSKHPIVEENEMIRNGKKLMPMILERTADR